MAEEEKKQEKKPKTKNKSSIDIDKSSIIFFTLIVIGIIVFVIIMIRNNNKQIYTTYFSEDIKVTINIEDEKIFKLSIDADGSVSNQEGTYKLIDEEKSEYEVTYEDKSTAKFIIDEEKGTLKYISDKYKLDFNKGDK